MTTEKCPTCGTECNIEWYGLELVENTGDETLASKSYTPLAIPLHREQGEEFMPIHSTDRGKIDGDKVPMRILNDEQAWNNHSQSLRRIAERGGLGLDEIVANFQHSRVRHLEDNFAVALINEEIAKQPRPSTPAGKEEDEILDAIWKNLQHEFPKINSDVLWGSAKRLYEVMKLDGTLPSPQPEQAGEKQKALPHWKIVEMWEKLSFDHEGEKIMTIDLFILGVKSLTQKL